jgi:PAS domain-containing protein
MSVKPAYDELKQKVQKLEQAVSEYNQTKDILRESEERFRKLFENVSSGVAVYEATENGEDFVFKDFNKAAEKIEQIQKDKLIG